MSPPGISNIGLHPQILIIVQSLHQGQGGTWYW
jgi:hypothetical protein